MKLKMKLIFSALIVFAATIITVSAQTSTGAQSATSTGGMGTPLSDQALNQKLSADLTGRNSGLSDQSISWFDNGNGNGYYGTYSWNDKQYMARYDGQGNYVDSYTRNDWSTGNVPQSLKSSYDKSMFKDQEVSGYWTSTDRSSKNSYLELKDKKGKKSRVWVDENGKFSSTAPKGSTNPR